MMEKKNKLKTALLTWMSPVKLEKLLGTGSFPGAFWEEGREAWKRSAGLTDRDCERLEAVRKDEETVKRLEETMERKGIRFATRLDGNYPARLARLEEKPFALFFLGSLPEEEKPSAAIVGARACSRYGRACAERFGGVLAGAGVQIISGMAYGVDSFSQRAAAEEGKSFAVLAGGVDQCYPKENRDLYDRLAAEGGVISEMPPGTQGIPQLFPRRNRIISGLADAVIVVEAREGSGSLITADFAADQGKLIYAVPGPVDSQLSAGTNELIRNGAILISDPSQLLEDLRMPMEASLAKSFSDEEKRMADMEENEKDVYLLLGAEPQDVDTLLEKSGYPVGILLGILLGLEVKGYVRREGMNRFCRK